MCHHACVVIIGPLSRYSQSSPSTMWILGMKLKLSDLATKAFTH